MGGNFINMVDTLFPGKVQLKVLFKFLIECVVPWGKLYEQGRHIISRKGVSKSSPFLLSGQ